MFTSEPTLSCIRRGCAWLAAVLVVISWAPRADAQVIIRDEDGATRIAPGGGSIHDLVRSSSGDSLPRLVPEVSRKMIVGAHFRYVTLPDVLLDQVSSLHPAFDTMSGGLSVGWPIGDGHRLVVELDVTGLSAATGNWLEKNAESNMETNYVDMGAVAIAADVTYRRHLWLHEKVAIMMGGGLGLGVIAGSISTSEVLPNCEEPSTCPHWSRVGQSEPSIPRILPVLHLLTGVHVEIASGLSARLEMGFKDYVYSGLSVGYSL